MAPHWEQIPGFEFATCAPVQDGHRCGPVLYVHELAQRVRIEAKGVEKGADCEDQHRMPVSRIRDPRRIVRIEIALPDAEQSEEFSQNGVVECGQLWLNGGERRADVGAIA
jgi:hypothetical protein